MTLNVAFISNLPRSKSVKRQDLQDQTEKSSKCDWNLNEMESKDLHELVLKHSGVGHYRGGPWVPYTFSVFVPLREILVSLLFFSPYMLVLVWLPAVNFCFPYCIKRGGIKFVTRKALWMNHGSTSVVTVWVPLDSPRTFWALHVCYTVSCLLTKEHRAVSASHFKEFPVGHSFNVFAMLNATYSRRRAGDRTQEVSWHMV